MNETLRIPSVKRGTTVFVLFYRKSAQCERRQKKEPEEHYGAHEKESPVQIRALSIERRFGSRRNIHPCIEMVAEQKNRHEKQRQDR